jgi:hypothetical protein
MVMRNIAIIAAAATSLAVTACGGLTFSSPSAGHAAKRAKQSAHHHHHRAAAFHRRRVHRIRVHRIRVIHSLLVIHDPGKVTGTLTGPCRTRDHGLLPDPSCTPGAIDPAVTQANIGSTICRAGYSESVRPPESQTEAFKWHVAEPAYGQHDVSGELDHLVSLELGGANDARNLWVEAGPIPNPKDAVEDALHRAVCDGKITLRAAQREIATNWIKAGAALGIRVP